MATQGGGAGLTKSQLLALLFGDPAGSAAPVTDGIGLKQRSRLHPWSSMPSLRLSYNAACLSLRDDIGPLLPHNVSL